MSPIKVLRTIKWNKALLADVWKALIAIFANSIWYLKLSHSIVTLPLSVCMCICLSLCLFLFLCVSLSLCFSFSLSPSVSFLAISICGHVFPSYNIPRHFSDLSVWTTLFTRNYFEPLSNQRLQKSAKLHRDFKKFLSRINCNVAHTKKLWPTHINSISLTLSLKIPIMLISIVRFFISIYLSYAL